MNYKTYFRFLIIVPIIMIPIAVILDFAYDFPESVNGYYGQLALDGFSKAYNIQLLLALLAFVADIMMCFFVRYSRELWILLISGFYIFASVMPELTIMSPISIVMVQIASLMAGLKISLAYLSPAIRDLF
tara:strand:- start:5909 stop:6301 length:393 start_codon:yes stop_codon:yes gene_type:complete